MITKFEEKHESNYKFRILENKSTSNTHHENQLRVFRERIEYLRKINEKNLSMMRNLKKTRKKMMKKARKKTTKKQTFRDFVYENSDRR